jgi:hypothetical protein
MTGIVLSNQALASGELVSCGDSGSTYLLNKNGKEVSMQNFFGMPISERKLLYSKLVIDKQDAVEKRACAIHIKKGLECYIDGEAKVEPRVRIYSRKKLQLFYLINWDEISISIAPVRFRKKFSLNDITMAVSIDIRRCTVWTPG